MACFVVVQAIAPSTARDAQTISVLLVLEWRSKLFFFAVKSNVWNLAFIEALKLS